MIKLLNINVFSLYFLGGGGICPDYMPDLIISSSSHLLTWHEETSSESHDTIHWLMEQRNTLGWKHLPQFPLCQLIDPYAGLHCPEWWGRRGPYLPVVLSWTPNNRWLWHHQGSNLQSKDKGNTLPVAPFRRPRFDNLPNPKWFFHGIIPQKTGWWTNTHLLATKQPLHTWFHQKVNDNGLQISPEPSRTTFSMLSTLESVSCTVVKQRNTHSCLQLLNWLQSICCSAVDWVWPGSRCRDGCRLMTDTLFNGGSSGAGWGGRSKQLANFPVSWTVEALHFHWPLRVSTEPLLLSASATIQPFSAPPYSQLLVGNMTIWQHHRD